MFAALAPTREAVGVPIKASGLSKVGDRCHLSSVGRARLS